MKLLLKTYVLFESRCYSPAEQVDFPDYLAKKLLERDHASAVLPSFYTSDQGTVSYEKVDEKPDETTVEDSVSAQSTPKRRRSKAVS